MIKLTIDHIPVEVQEGMTILGAAASVGITIPTMCVQPGLTNNPSCMVCLVKDADRGTLVPSCAMPVAENMHILTDSADVTEARREAIELLLSDHLGDCEAPCRMTCPAFMDIPLMNRLIAAGDFDRALHIVRDEIALPFILGYICPAPCEKGCKRKPIDGAVSICMLKRSAAMFADPAQFSSPSRQPLTGKKVAVIGTGPAGLSAAFYLLQAGHSCVLYDSAETAGGAMRHSIPADILPREVLDAEIGVIARLGGEFRMNNTLDKQAFQDRILPAYDAVILASGHSEQGPGELYGLHPDAGGSFVSKKDLSTSLPGVFACGNIIRQQKMAVQAVAQGKMAARQADAFLQPDPGRIAAHAARNSASVTGHLTEPEWPEYLQESTHDSRVEPAGGFPSGFTREEAMREALRCMHCDCRKPVSCKLRQYADEYGANRRKFAGPDRKRLTRMMQHEEVVYEPEKCIRCGLCVEITARAEEPVGLAFAGRGFDVVITVPFSETIGEALKTAGRECVASCPTGALAFKNREERNR